MDDARLSKLEEARARFGGLSARDMLLGLVDARETLTQVAADLGVTRPTLYYWLANAGLKVDAEQDIVALDNRTNEPRKPSRQARATVAAVLEAE